MVLSVELTGDQELIERIQNMPNSMHKALVKKVTTLALALERKVKTEKLSGQVLNKRTGALQSSIQNKVNDSGNLVTGTVYSDKSVPYAAIHEFGGIINHPGGTAYWFNAKSGVIEFVSNAKASLVLKGEFPRTKPHVIKMPERSYLRSSLAEMAVQIKTELREAVVEGLNEK